MSFRPRHAGARRSLRRPATWVVLAILLVALAAATVALRVGSWPSRSPLTAVEAPPVTEAARTAPASRSASASASASGSGSGSLSPTPRTDPSRPISRSTPRPKAPAGDVSALTPQPITPSSARSAPSGATGSASSAGRSTPTAGAPSSRTSTPTPSTSAPPKPATGDAGLEAEVLRLVNVERADAGCAAVHPDTRLTTAARRHSQDMADQGYFSHTSADGRTPWDRMTAVGYTAGSAENIAAGATTAAAVMKMWMDSDGHRANILNCANHALGTGVGRGGPYGVYWTQDFGRT